MSAQSLTSCSPAQFHQWQRLSCRKKRKAFKNQGGVLMIGRLSEQMPLFSLNNLSQQYLYSIHVTFCKLFYILQKKEIIIKKRTTDTYFTLKSAHPVSLENRGKWRWVKNTTTKTLGSVGILFCYLMHINMFLQRCANACVSVIMCGSSLQRLTITFYFNVPLGVSSLV